MTSIVTIFKNIKETETPFFRDVDIVLARIKDGATKNLVKEIRNTKDKEQRNTLKKRLPAICFSGKFNKRNDSSLIEHGGLICLDFDGYEKKKILLDHKEKLTRDQYVYSCFISPRKERSLVFDTQVLLRWEPAQKLKAQQGHGRGSQSPAIKQNKERLMYRRSQVRNTGRAPP